MVYIAFTLGLFGSLHCLGMCGPLAFALLPGIEKGGWQNTLRVVSYNVGRVLSYLTLGIIAGLTSSALNLSGLQKPVSIVLGILMIVLFAMSMDLEKLLFKSKKYTAVFNGYRKFLGQVTKRFQSHNPLLLGAVNGLIPCGLVYLALAGALAEGSVAKGGLFMLLFGIGTMPAMILLLTGMSILQLRKKFSFRKVFAYLQLFVGLFLIYRALAIELPDNLELYWSMGKVMCH